MGNVKRGVLAEDAEHLKDVLTCYPNEKDLTLVSMVPDICLKEDCILGVDEAGRGPVLGPMVYGICYCPLSRENELKTLGCADSKSLTEEKREDIFAKLHKESDCIGWAVHLNSPVEISNKMLSRQKVSLNQIAQDSTAHLLNEALEAGILISHVYVDTVGMPDKYQAKLEALFPQLKITVSKKADSIYPIVGAASICAKVTRDVSLKNWQFKENEVVENMNFGSGYPNDPVTKKFLLDNVNPVLGFPQIVRFSWSTADNILQEKAHPVEWLDYDDDDKTANSKSKPITSFFQRASGSEPKKRPRHEFFSERKLSSTFHL